MNAARRCAPSVAAVATIAATIVLGACGGEAATGPFDRSFGTDDADRICDLRDGSCDGGGDGPAAAVAGTVRELQRSFLEGDVDRLCSLMTRPAHVFAGSFAHGFPATCARNVRHGFGVIEQGSGWRDRPNPRVGAVELDGDRATAQVVEDGRPADVELARDDGGWKLAAPFGIPLADARRHVVAAASAPFPKPPPGERPVVVRDANGDPCPPIGNGATDPESDLLRRPVPKGCRIVAEAHDIDFSLLSAFGEFHFGRCKVSDFQFAIGRDGRTWMDGMNFATVRGDDGESGCGDVYRCERRPQINPAPERPLAPWKGRLTSDGSGGFVHRMNACVATCVGFFTGRLTMRLERRAGRWRLIADRAAVGSSGWEIDGEMTVTNRKLRISAAGPGRAG